MPELNFKGKEFVRNHHLSVPQRPLQPDAERSVGEPRFDGNLIIHGDNLHALKALLPLYANRVNCIYIDPPYNTGNEGWCYNDNVNSPHLQAWLNQNPVGVDDGLRHDKWCCMMWPRLKLLHELLAEDGVIFISIDDNEQHCLRMMMDEIFGGDNFVADFVWNSTKSITNPALVSISHTHNIAYAKQIYILKENRKNFKLPPILDGFANLDNDSRGPWKADPFEAGGERPNQMYPITNPNTNEIFYPTKGNCWKNDLNKFKELITDNRIVFGKNGTGRPQRKRFLWEAKERGLTPNTWWDEVGTTTHGTKLVNTILGAGIFPNPKPITLLHRILFFASGKNSIILDSFAGSGTTAHAVLALNKQDGGNRKFILVECEEYADRITAERVRRVIKGVPTAKDENLQHGLGGDFTYCALGSALEMDRLLSGKDLPNFRALGALLFHIATNEVIDTARIDESAGYLGASTQYHLWLIYKPDVSFLQSDDSALTLSKAREYAAAYDDKPHLVFAPARFVSDEILRTENIPVIYQPLPWALYRIGEQ